MTETRLVFDPVFSRTTRMVPAAEIWYRNFG